MELYDFIINDGTCRATNTLEIEIHKENKHNSFRSGSEGESLTIVSNMTDYEYV